MVDRAFCNSSFLALRYVGKPGIDFCEELQYRYPPIPSTDNIAYVSSADEIDEFLIAQSEEITRRYERIGILLSGGMDSAILASYFPGTDAYSFRFLGGDYQHEELDRAEIIAERNCMTFHYIDIDWSTVENCLKPVMLSKGGPVHSIEPQIYQGALLAKMDGIDLMVIGDASDYVFGGMDKLLSRDWFFDDFVKRYIYIDPFEVLIKPLNVLGIFENYRTGDEIDFIKVLEELAAQESYGSYCNAFAAAGLDYFDPYENLRMKDKLDLERVRKGESKYLIREVFRKRYPGFDVPEKNPMPRPVDTYFRNWTGPKRQEFRKDIDISKFDGNQRWLLWCLEEFLNMVDEMRN